MSTSPITDHEEQAVARLSWQLQDKPVYTALLRTVVARLQLLEDLAWQYLGARYLDDAEGVLLDGLGESIGYPRPGGPYPLGLDDDEYRARVRAWAKVNRSCGTLEELLEIVRLLLGENCEVVHLTEQYPAGFSLAVGVTTALSTEREEALVAFVHAAKAAGVGIDNITVYDGLVYGWLEDPNPLVGTLDDGTNLPGAGTFAKVISFNT